ncbi:NADPH-dependent ferric siderophore reductase [Comamonas odontotermitis]|uniref:NADPH-dependent ferric siderophore reductase n=1 Tax=Comamonas odontotermitis TaxID=379895 RepID=A0ABR6RHM1_9BURK|nr:siderophore-interacting protein [Comamonas odontotermitis]MBB6578646.1 NADPH-dependent ferric siderophore reductase [Comamonas odontotermitis]
MSATEIDAVAKPQALEARITLPRAAAYVQWLVRHWRDEGVDVEEPAPGQVRLSLSDVGVVELNVAATRQLDCRLVPASARMGELMQLSLTEHLAEFADEMAWPDGSWDVLWSGQAPRSPGQLQVLQVCSNRELTPLMRRLRLQGDGVRAFADGLHVRMLLPTPGEAPAWPEVQQDGRLQWPVGKPPMPRRTYTIRAINFEEQWMDVDVLLHPDAKPGVQPDGQSHGQSDVRAEAGASPGAGWALQAAPGSTVGVLSPAGGLAPRAARRVLVADACALPAAARLVQAAPDTPPSGLLLWVANPQECAAWDAVAGVDPAWLHDGAPGASPAGIAQVLRWLALQDWSGTDTVLWVAGGLPLTQAVRSWVAGQPHLARVRCMIHTYWR